MLPQAPAQEEEKKNFKLYNSWSPLGSQLY